MFNEEQSFQILDFVFVITNHITKLTCSTGLLLILLVNNSWHLVNYHLFSRKINIISFRKIKLFLKAFTSFLPEVLVTQKERATPYLLAKKHRLQPGFVDVSHTETRKYRSHHIRCFWLNLVLLAYIYSYWHISMLTLLLSLMMLANNFYNCLFVHVLYN